MQAEAHSLGEQLFADQPEKRARFVARLVDMCDQAQDKDILLVHNPGGWGNTRIEHCHAWERSLAQGLSQAVAGLGFRWALVDHLRSGTGFRECWREGVEQARFFTGKAKVLAAELKFVLEHLGKVRVILLGVSQGAGFSNRVMLELDGARRVYSLEFGLPFFYRSRRVITERILAIDGNGLVPDALAEFQALPMTRAYLAAPFRWLRRRLQGERVKFADCINVRGHDYHWDYPEVQQRVTAFLEANLGVKEGLEIHHETRKVH